MLANVYSSSNLVSCNSSDRLTKLRGMLLRRRYTTLSSYSPVVFTNVSKPISTLHYCFALHLPYLSLLANANEEYSIDLSTGLSQHRLDSTNFTFVRSTSSNPRCQNLRISSTRRFAIRSSYPLKRSNPFSIIRKVKDGKKHVSGSTRHPINTRYGFSISSVALIVTSLSATKVSQLLYHQLFDRLWKAINLVVEH